MALRARALDYYKLADLLPGGVQRDAALHLPELPEPRHGVRWLRDAPPLASALVHCAKAVASPTCATRANLGPPLAQMLADAATSALDDIFAELCSRSSEDCPTRAPGSSDGSCVEEEPWSGALARHHRASKQQPLSWALAVSQASVADMVKHGELTEDRCKMLAAYLPLCGGVDEKLGPAQAEAGLKAEVAKQPQQPANGVSEKGCRAVVAEFKQQSCGDVFGTRPATSNDRFAVDDRLVPNFRLSDEPLLEKTVTPARPDAQNAGKSFVLPSEIDIEALSVVLRRPRKRWGSADFSNNLQCDLQDAYMRDGVSTSDDSLLAPPAQLLLRRVDEASAARKEKAPTVEELLGASVEDLVAQLANRTLPEAQCCAFCDSLICSLQSTTQSLRDKPEGHSADLPLELQAPDSLPSVWQLHTSVVPDDLASGEVEFGAQAPTPPVVNVSTLEDRLFAGCWRRGRRLLDLPSLPVREPAVGLLLPEDIAVLMGEQVGIRTYRAQKLPCTTAFFGVFPGANPPFGETDALATEALASSSAREEFKQLLDKEMQAWSSADPLAVPLLSASSDRPRNFATHAVPNETANLSVLPTLIPMAAPSPESLGEEIWVGDKGGTGKQQTWMRLQAFRLAKVPERLFESGKDNQSLAAQTTSVTPQAVCALPQPNGGGADPAQKPSELEFHDCEATAEEFDLAEQLRGDAQRQWDALRLHVDFAGCAVEERETYPDLACLEQLLRHHQVRLIHAQPHAQNYVMSWAARQALDRDRAASAAPHTSAESVATGDGDAAKETNEDMDLNVCRALLVLYTLVALYDELTESGTLQAVYCGDALLARFPHSVLRASIYANQALLWLHDLVQTHVSTKQATSTAHAGTSLPRLCAYAGCAGCTASIDDGSLALLEQSKVRALLRIAERARACGRRLAVVFSSQRLIVAVKQCLVTSQKSIAIQEATPAVATLDAMTPATVGAQVLLETKGTLLVHQTAITWPQQDSFAALSPDELTAAWEVHRVLRQHCTVVAYQPLALPGAMALVNIGLRGCVSAPPGTASERQQQLGTDQEYSASLEESVRMVPGPVAGKRCVPDSGRADADFDYQGNPPSCDDARRRKVEAPPGATDHPRDGVAASFADPHIEEARSYRGEWRSSGVELGVSHGAAVQRGAVGQSRRGASAQYDVHDHADPQRGTPPQAGRHKSDWLGSDERRPGALRMGATGNDMDSTPLQRVCRSRSVEKQRGAPRLQQRAPSKDGDGNQAQLDDDLWQPLKAEDSRANDTAKRHAAAGGAAAGRLQYQSDTRGNSRELPSRHKFQDDGHLDASIGEYQRRAATALHETGSSHRGGLPGNSAVSARGIHMTGDNNAQMSLEPDGVYDVGPSRLSPRRHIESNPESSLCSVPAKGDHALVREDARDVGHSAMQRGRGLPGYGGAANPADREDVRPHPVPRASAMEQRGDDRMYVGELERRRGYPEYRSRSVDRVPEFDDPRHRALVSDARHRVPPEARRDRGHSRGHPLDAERPPFDERYHHSQRSHRSPQEYYDDRMHYSAHPSYMDDRHSHLQRQNSQRSIFDEQRERSTKRHYPMSGGTAGWSRPRTPAGTWSHGGRDIPMPPRRSLPGSQPRFRDAPGGLMDSVRAPPRRGSRGPWG